MKQEELLKSCSELLYKLCDDVERLNSLNCYDINIASEYFFIPLINMLFNCDMRNINSEKKNAKAIDLYDKNGKLAVQVTSDFTADKIHKTLHKYLDDKLYNQYERLIVVVIVKKHNYIADFTADTKGLFAFDKNKDIFTIEKLIEYIRDIDVYQIENIQQYLKFQIDPITDSPQIISINKDFSTIGSTTSGYLNENYFEIDDESFVTEFTKRINDQKAIFISSLSVEEGRYCVLNLIHKIKPDIPVYVILSRGCWEKADIFFSECIVLPNFISEEIPSLKNNTTVFIQSIENRNEKTLMLHCRTRSFLAKKLQENGYDEPYKLLERTQGVYYYIKKELYDGSMALPVWSSDKNKALIIADLIGKWTECDGDKKFIETLYGNNYDCFISHLNSYIGSEKPFLLKKQDWYNKTIFELTDHFLAIQAHRLSFDKSTYDSFFELVKTVLCDEDPMFDLSAGEGLFTNKSIQSKYSSLLKQGIIQTLIILAVYCDQQIEVNSCIDSILGIIKSVKDWAYFSQYFDSLCEASPDVAIKRLEEEIQNDTGLKELFSAESSRFILGKHNYTHFLWALEQLLSSKDHVVRAAKILFALGEKAEKCLMGNNPREDLEKLFCPWYNVSALTCSEKVELAKWASEKYTYFWNILYSELVPESSILLYNHTFSYRKDQPITQYTCEDIYYFRVEFTKILISKAGNDVDKTIKLISILPYVPEDIFVIMQAKINDVLVNSPDSIKEKIKTELRKLIYNERRYASKEITQDLVNRISKIESFCLSVSFDDEAYDYLYLVDSYNNMPIFNPVRYDEKDEKNYERNTEVRNSVLRKEFQRMKESEIEFDHFLSLLNLEPYNTFGQKIAEFYSLYIYDERVLDSIIISTNNVNAAVHYALGCTHDNDSIYSIIEHLRLQHFGDSFYLGFLLSLPLSDKVITYLEELPEGIQKNYWNCFPIYKIEDKSFVNYTLENLFKYHCFEILFNFASVNVQWFSTIEVINIISNSLNIINADSSSLNDYMVYNIESLLDNIYQRIGNNFDDHKDLLSLELRLFGNIQWEKMKCTQYYFKKDASFYAYVIKLSCKQDDGTYYLDTDTDKDTYKFYYNLERKAKFCPGEEDGNINRNTLNAWIQTFKEILDHQRQSTIYTKKLGELFIYSPAGDDGLYPHEYIREVIERIDDESLINAFVRSVIYGRGCCNITYGSDEYRLSQKYREIALRYQISYPQTAKIFFAISEYYMRESIHDRKLAENGVY